jgi:hypothetical protein
LDDLLRNVWTRAWNLWEVTSWWLLNFYLYNFCTLFANLAPNATNNNKQQACNRWKNYVENCIHDCEFCAHLNNLRGWIGPGAWWGNHIICIIYYRYIVTSRNCGTWITTRCVSWVWWICRRTAASIVHRVTWIIYLLLCAICCRICNNYDRLSTSWDTLGISTLSSLVVNRPIIGL